MEQKFEDRYDFEEKISKILRNSNEQFDIILTFKFISEFTTGIMNSIEDYIIHS